MLLVVVVVVHVVVVVVVVFVEHFPFVEESSVSNMITNKSYYLSFCNHMRLSGEMCLTNGSSDQKRSWIIEI